MKINPVVNLTAGVVCLALAVALYAGGLNTGAVVVNAFVGLFNVWVWQHTRRVC